MKMELSNVEYITHPRPLKYFKIIIIILTNLLVCCFFLCYLDENVIAEGEIRPCTKETVIRSLFNGTVEKVNYKNSSYVNKGDVLYSLNSSYEKENLKNLLQLEELYNTNVQCLKELLILHETTTEDTINYEENIIKYNSRYAAFVTSYKSYKNNYELKKNTFARQEFLYPGIISKQEYENYENEYLQCYFMFSTWLQNQKIQAREDYAINYKNLEECQLKILQIRQLIDNANCLASCSGFINEVRNIKVGDFISDGTEILRIIPNENSIKCIAKIPNNNISKIKIGQVVFLEIKDLPFTKYGKLKGKVSMIPKDVIENENQYYPIEIELERNYLQNFKKEKIFIKIGTRTSVKIITDRDTIFQKILQALIVYDK